MTTLWGKVVQCAVTNQAGSYLRNFALIAQMGSLFSAVLLADISMAQAQSTPDVAVLCQGTDKVSTKKLEELCIDLRHALSERYPSVRFALPNSVSQESALVVTLDASVASKSGLVASLSWQTAGKVSTRGPEMGFSITDKDITPDMQMKFLNRLVQNTQLPL